MEDTKPAYKIRGIPRLLNIKGYDLYYKDPPLKNDLYVVVLYDNLFDLILSIILFHRIIWQLISTDKNDHICAGKYQRRRYSSDDSLFHNDLKPKARDYQGKIRIAVPDKPVKCLAYLIKLGKKVIFFR